METIFIIRIQKHLFRILFIGLILFLFHGCAANKEWASRIKWKGLEFNNLPRQTDYPDQSAVILLDEGEMETFGNAENGFSEFRRHRILKVFNHRGRKYANVVIPFSSGTKIENIRARTISPAGKITVLKKEDIYDVSLYPNFIFYSDQHAKIFTFPAVEDGAILEYKYKVTIGNRMLWHAWSFQSKIPTRYSRFTLIKPVEWNLKYQVYGIHIQPDSIVNQVNSKSTYIWEARDVPALQAEFGMPPSSELAASIALAPNWSDSWEDITNWYHELAAPRMKPGKELKRLVQSLTQDTKTDVEKLKKIHGWVRDRVRYIAVAVGIGGYQPHFVDDVFTNQYGDCKDMTALLCAMAREAGIPANQAIISTWQNGVPDTTLPTPFQFNHVVSYFPTLGDSGLWIDATDKGCPFGQLPWYDQGLPVLVVGEKGEAKMMKTPRVSPDKNRTEISWRVGLAASGSAKIKGKMFLWGAPAAEMRRSFANSSRMAQQKWLETDLAQRCSGAILDSFVVTGVDEIEDPMTITFSFHSKTFALLQMGQMTFRPNAIQSLQLPDYFRSGRRHHPIRFNYGSKTELNLIVTLPGGWVMKNENRTDSLRSEFGAAYWRWEKGDKQVSIRAGYLLNGDDVSPQQYISFQQFLDTVRENDLWEAVLVRKQ